jgi:hypothetical protein
MREHRPRPANRHGCRAVPFFLFPVAALGALGCERAPTHEVTIVEGANTTRFTVRSAFTEYVELPGDRNELRLTLASYAVSCERWVPPREGDTALTVVIITPPDTRPSVASYGWTGIPERGEPLHAAYALPKAELGVRSRLFEPGGTIRLTGVQIDPHGIVTGTLAFEFPGEGERPATRIDGGFTAKMCRLGLAAP